MLIDSDLDLFFNAMENRIIKHVSREFPIDLIPKEQKTEQGVRVVQEFATWSELERDAQKNKMPLGAYCFVLWQNKGDNYNWFLSGPFSSSEHAQQHLGYLTHMDRASQGHISWLNMGKIDDHEQDG